MGFDLKVCLVANSQFHTSRMKTCKQIAKRPLSLFNSEPSPCYSRDSEKGLIFVDTTYSTKVYLI